MNYKKMFHDSLIDVLGYRRGAAGGREHHLVDFAARKWQLFGDKIDFQNKTVLDVGCASGHSSIEAWARGAKEVIGFDTRKDILTVAEDVKKKLQVTDQISFEQADVLDLDPDASEEYRVDIVLCLGLMHYLPADEYRNILAALIFLCNQYLVLEMYLMNNKQFNLEILDPGNGKIANHKPITVPSFLWLRWILQQAGFKVIFSDFDYQKKDIRGLVVAERLPIIVGNETTDFASCELDTVYIVPPAHPELEAWLNIHLENRLDLSEEKKRYDNIYWQNVINSKVWQLWPVVYNKKTYKLADGFHRLLYTKATEASTIKVRIVEEFKLPNE